MACLPARQRGRSGARAARGRAGEVLLVSRCRLRRSSLLPSALDALAYLPPSLPCPAPDVINFELALADITQIEKRLERLKKTKGAAALRLHRCARRPRLLAGRWPGLACLA